MNGVKPNEPKKVYNNILEVIGHSPLVKLNRVPQDHGVKCQMFAKCEYLHPGGSLKDRIAYTMVQAAKNAGRAKEGQTRFVEPTSGNTGIGVSLTSAVLGFDCTIVTPDKNSDEKMSTMRLLGSEIIQTPAMLAHNDPGSYLSVTQKILESDPKAISLNQYTNEVNPLTHHEHTAVEVLDALGSVDMFVMGVGTGGTVTGMGRMFKEKYPECIVVAVDPQGSVMFDKGKPSFFFVEGIGGDFVPDVLDKSVIDEVAKTTDYQSFNMSRELIRKEGLLCGGSSGAITYAAIEAAKKHNLGPDKKVVVMLPDSIRNYMTKFVTDQWMEAHLFKEPPQRNFLWWNRSISNLKLMSSVPTVKETNSCLDAMKAMGPLNKVAFVVNNDGLLTGVVTKHNLRSEATNPKKEGDIDFNDAVDKYLMKDVYKISENKGNPTVGLAARILDITPFVVVVEEYLNGGSKPGYIPKGIITSEIVLDYILEHQHHI